MPNYAKLYNNIQKHAKYYPILLLLLSFDHTQHTQNYIKVYQITEIYISVQNWTILYKNEQNFTKSYIAIWSHSTYTIQNYTKVYKFTKKYISVQNYTVLYKTIQYCPKAMRYYTIVLIPQPFELAQPSLC